MDLLRIVGGGIETSIFYIYIFVTVQLILISIERKDFEFSSAPQEVVRLHRITMVFHPLDASTWDRYYFPIDLISRRWCARSRNLLHAAESDDRIMQKRHGHAHDRGATRKLLTIDRGDVIVAQLPVLRSRLSGPRYRDCGAYRYYAAREIRERQVYQTSSTTRIEQ